MMTQCPRGCDAFLEYVGVDDGFGLYGNLCCDIWQCPACLETFEDDCFNCEDDEEFGDHEHQLEVRAEQNRRDFDPKPQYSEFALIGCSTCGATGQPMFGDICANCFASGHGGYTDPGEWAEAMNKDDASEVQNG